MLDRRQNESATLQSRETFQFATIEFELGLVGLAEIGMSNRHLTRPVSRSIRSARRTFAARVRTSPER